MIINGIFIMIDIISYTDFSFNIFINIILIKFVYINRINFKST